MSNSETIPDEQPAWLDELNLGSQFRTAVVRVGEMLAERGDTYTAEVVERALLGWLAKRVELSLKDAPEYLLHDSAERSIFRSLLGKETQGEGRDRASIFRGMREFNPAHLREMILFFASKPPGVLKTKLNKLLWYSDFLHYRIHSTAISGASYVHRPFGPAPEGYERELSSLLLEKALTIRSKKLGDYSGEIIEAVRPAKLETLPENALEILEAVSQRFRDYGSRDISRISHAEAGYTETELGEKISYEYAHHLKVNFPLRSSS